MRVLRVELRRLLRGRTTWMLSLLTIASPVLGLTIYRPLSSYGGSGYVTSVNGTFIANPALAGALVGALLFSLLTALELSRVARYRMDVLTEAMISPFQAYLIRTIALLLTSVAVQGLTLLVWLPFTQAWIGSAFQLDLYVALYTAIMLPALLYAVLFTAAASILTGRLELSLTLSAAFVLLSFTVWQDDWLLRWINPPIAYVSDAFSASRLLDSVVYNRLFWLLALSGFWVASCLGIRRYAQALLPSLLRNARQTPLLLLFVSLALGAGVSYERQPFVDHSDIDLEGVYAYETANFEDKVTFSSIHVQAVPDLAARRQSGLAVYELHNSSGKPQTISFRLNTGYTFSSVTANGQPVPSRDLADDMQNTKTMEVDIPGDEAIELRVAFGGFPQEWNLLSLSQGGSVEISRDYVYLANTDFAPMPDNFAWEGEEMNPYTIELTLPAGMTPVLFGTSAARDGGETPEGSRRWLIESSGFSVILYAGDYVSHQVQVGELDIEFWYSAKHAPLMETYEVDKVLKQVFEYCTATYGPLSFYNDNKMRIIEIGTAGGGYAGNGASVISEDSFSERSLRDARKGSGGNEVLAHEIIHQWWGLGTMFDSVDSDDAWSSEGLTVYTTYRLMKALYGEAYAQANYVDKWQAEVDDYYQNYYVRYPRVLDKLPQSYRLRIQNGVSAMKQYAEMPLKLLKAERLVGGEEAMDALLKKLFNREIDYAAPFLTYQQFLDAAGLTKEALSLD